MLGEFLAANRHEILSQARARVALRSAPLARDAELTHGLPVFLDQLSEALRKAKLSQAVDHAEIRSSASQHGDHLFHQGRSHLRLQSLIDRSLADVRLDAGLLNLERVPVWEIMEEAEIGASVVAQARDLQFEVTTVNRAVIVEADRPILAAAIANLLQNAFKFTRPGTMVKLRASTTTSRVLIEVEDECGGLPAGETESLLRPFVQKSKDRTGMGLGLSICLKAARMMAGQLHIRDLPGKGCVFTLDLPKQPPPPTSIRAHDRRSEDGHGGSGRQDGTPVPAVRPSQANR